MFKESPSNVANISDFSVRDFNLAVTASSLAYESHRPDRIDQGKYKAELKPVNKSSSKENSSYSI